MNSTNQRTVNTINDRLIENIVYTVIRRLNLSTGATGSSIEGSIIDVNGILTSNITPINDNTINFGQTGFNLNSIYTYRLNIDNNEINSRLKNWLRNKTISSPLNLRFEECY